MAIYPKWERNWYNSIPIEESPAKKWEYFSADKLEGNEIKCGSETLAKIPNLPGLISRKTRSDGYGGKTVYIELITERRYDPEKKQTRNKRVCIGIDVDHIWRGMMVINEKYHDYFDRDGKLLITPRIEKPGKEKPAQPVPAGDGPKEAGTDTGTDEEPKTEESTKNSAGTGTGTTGPEKEENGMKTEAENRETEGNDQAIQEELDRKEHRRDQREFLDSMLTKYRYHVDGQLRKDANTPMSRYQVKRINELLKDIQTFLSGYEYSGYLQLGEEGDEENGTPMTYGDMAVLLKGYESVMTAYRMGRLWYYK